MRNILHNKRQGSGFYITAGFTLSQIIHIWARIQTLSPVTILFSLLSETFLPVVVFCRTITFSAIFTLPWMTIPEQGDNTIPLPVRVPGPIPPCFAAGPFFYLYRTFSLLLITWKRDFTGRASPERKPPCPCMPFLIRRRITDLSRVIMPAFRYSGKWRFYPWGQKCGNMETGQQKNHHDGFFSKKWEHMSFI